MYHTVRAGELAVFCARKFGAEKLLHLCISNAVIESCLVEFLLGDVQLIILSVY